MDYAQLFVYVFVGAWLAVLGRIAYWLWSEQAAERRNSPRNRGR